MGAFAADTVGSKEMPSTGRLGKIVLPPVTSSQLACAATPVPRLNPIQTLPSLVPAIATLWNFGEYFTWLMNERSARACLVMFCVVGLLVICQLDPDMVLFPPE